MLTPGPDHPITITPNTKTVRVEIDGRTIAETTHALTLREASYPAVQYVPRGDVDQRLVTKTSRSTHCPYKGDASYYSIALDGRTLENAIWSYEHPYPAMESIRGYMAFYPDRVTLTER